MTADEPTVEEARALLAELQGRPAWALIRRQADEGVVTAVAGERAEVESLLDVPLVDGIPPAGRRFDHLLAVPFRQVRERGFEAHDDGTPLTVVTIDTEVDLPLATALAAIEPVDVELADRGGFEIGDDDYADLVERVIAEEIGQGEGANLVIGRSYRAVVADWSAATALTVFARLLERERGAYWTYCFFTGDRFLIGASPERHVSVTGGQVRMNPISGTFRVRAEPGQETRLKERLLDFLADEKEIYELFMVVDEELKMMCDICHEGGQVLGPFLKPMTHLVHTEYLLAGRTDRDVREVLRDTMYAATVTGSPVENACRLIARHEPTGRGYYGAALALIGRDPDGRQTADSPIVIRSADVDPQGRLRVTAGATLVRDSDPRSEVAETHAKAGGILSAFGLADPPPAPAADVAALARDEDVLIALGSRNQRLSRFWLNDQGGNEPTADLAGKRAVLLDAEDDFVNMLCHVLGVLGISTDVVRHEDYTPEALRGYDLVLVGPGPGDPRDGDDPKIARIRAAVDQLLAEGQPFLAVCLGHQTLCHALGLPLGFKDIVFQGTQSPVEIGSRTERVGFYNTFVARAGTDADLPAGVEVAADPAGGDVHLIAGPHYRGIQFHAESVLTQHGDQIIARLVAELIAAPAASL